MAFDLELIEVGDKVLAFDDDVRDGTVICSYINRATGELREQLVEVDRFVKNRSTVERRMDRMHPDMITPMQVLY
jgi:hypothetical protein